MPRKTHTPPSYRLHRPSGQARVILDGKHVYLGKYGTEESHQNYHRLIAEWLATRQRGPVVATVAPVISVNELVLAFWHHAKQRYVKDGRPTSEIASFRAALRPVRRLYGREPVSEFGPLALVACREELKEAGYCRKRINQHLGRIRHVFKWGVAREMVPETVWRALCAVEGLRPGEARETEPVRPVPEAHIAAIQPHVTPQIWAMVNLQLWSGCRPGEACAIRTVDIDMRGAIWEFRLSSHKTEHHGKQRVIYLGPHAQQVIKPWLKTDLCAPLFSPREARKGFLAERWRNRKTRVPPSQRRRKRKTAPRRPPGDRYNVGVYGRAVRRACQRAGLPTWSPNRLRHNAATRIRAAYGIEAARVILGHSSVATSEIYAEIDREKAREIMARIG